MSASAARTSDRPVRLAEEAANFNVSVFKNSKVKQITHYAGEEFPKKKGQVMTVSFELDGQEFTPLNSGPQFKFTEAVSFVINSDTQEEIDPAAAGLGETHRWRPEGSGMRMGRGQVRTLLASNTGKVFAEWVKDPAGLERVTHEVWQMTKLDLAKLEKAFAGK